MELIIFIYLKLENITIVMSISVITLNNTGIRLTEFTFTHTNMGITLFMFMGQVLMTWGEDSVQVPQVNHGFGQGAACECQLDIKV